MLSVNRILTLYKNMADGVKKGKNMLH